ncbi:DUF6629 family protein, partial [Streptomyces longwoodensis]|uniref:DUF6629 family protein n=1 Tax=Streptomyces longwoodensis TaxID=68231 RepID=UPI003408800C
HRRLKTDQVLELDQDAVHRIVQHPEEPVLDRGPLASGAVTAALLTHALATRTVRAEIRGHTVGYVLGLPHPQLLVTGYLVATIGAFLLSGDRVLVTLGSLVAVGALVCGALWRLEFVSTWCAVAALCSVVVWAWVGRRTPAVVGA